MSNPRERPGPATEFDWPYYELMRERIADLVPATRGLALRRAWAATIDYTPDHLPILGPLLREGVPIDGTTVASAGGHGMMWGPGVARAAADLAVSGRTELLDVTDLGLDRFDEQGREKPDFVLKDLPNWFPVCDNDLLFTGTPEGVGPLLEGDVVEVAGGNIEYMFKCGIGTHA